MSDDAWFATAPDGAPVVLKWFPDETVAERYAVLLPALDELRSRGVPVPEYPHVLAVDGWTLSAQQVLPGCVGAIVTRDGGAGGRERRRHGRHRLSAVATRPAPLGCVRRAHAHGRRGRVGDARAAAHPKSSQRGGPRARGGRRCRRRPGVVPDRRARAPGPAHRQHPRRRRRQTHRDHRLGGRVRRRSTLRSRQVRVRPRRGTINRSGTTSRPPVSSRGCCARTSPTTRCGARPGRSTTTPTTCRASSTAPSASSIGTGPRPAILHDRTSPGFRPGGRG